jgi:glutamine synthetase
MLAAGLKGIQDKINPKEPMEKDIYHMESKERAKENILSLPDNLGSALDFMAKSTLAREALGAHVFEHFLYIKRKEWGSYIKHVTDWELKHLLPIL